METELIYDGMLHFANWWEREGARGRDLDGELDEGRLLDIVDEFDADRNHPHLPGMEWERI